MFDSTNSVSITDPTSFSSTASASASLNGNKTGTIVYLASNHSAEVDNLLRSLELLYKNFNNQFKYPVIIFHEENFKQILNESTDRIQNYSAFAPIYFQQVKFEVPSSFDPENQPFVYKNSGYPGYNCMIRFFFKQIFQHPLINQYKYYWRLDTDSFLHNEIRYDLFDVMRQSGYVYGTVHITTDYPPVVQHMDTVVKAYILTHETKAKQNNYSPDSKMVYNNFEIVDIERFKDSKVWEFVEYIDKSNFIFRGRWGDAPLRWVEINLFLDKNKEFHIFCGIDYEHSHHFKRFTNKCENGTLW